MKPPHRPHGGSPRPPGGHGPRRDQSGSAPYRGGDRPRNDGPRGEGPRGEGPRTEGRGSEWRDRPPGPRAADGGPRRDDRFRSEGAPRGERRFADRPSRAPSGGAGTSGERFGGERTPGDRPRVERSSQGRPWEQRGREDRPRGEGARAEAPRGERFQRGPRDHAPRNHGPRDHAHADQRPPATPAGAVWLYGHHAVAAALANPSRRLRRLLATEEAEAALAAIRPLPWPLAPERTERARIDHLLGREAVHQGAALLADPLAPPPLAQMLDRPGPVLVLDQVADPRNVGAILRSAAAFGAAGVIVQDRNAPDETGSLAKAASGALETVPLLRAVNIARTLLALKASDRWVVGLDAAGPSRLDGAALAGRKLVLVLGAEGEGMRRLTRDSCDLLAALAMPGSMESLNVSAAAAVALYEITRTA
ncbi:MAG: 23S rRNA (guanosine(2251)-2'-O)-methyltransferase RlmB [Rhodospirillales bacterium]|nr:23S rRNA (guanosine(2251)-2'-O)-methyltransferase RlmB [Rhodospirillales bacterium]